MINRVLYWVSISKFEDAGLCMRINDAIFMTLNAKECPPPRASTHFGRFFAVGGSERDKQSNCVSIEKYCQRLNTWKHFHIIPGLRMDFGLVQLNDELIVLGGRNQLGVLTTSVCIHLPLTLLSIVFKPKLLIIFVLSSIRFKAWMWKLWPWRISRQWQQPDALSPLPSLMDTFTRLQVSISAVWTRLKGTWRWKLAHFAYHPNNIEIFLW